MKGGWVLILLSLALVVPMVFALPMCEMPLTQDVECEPGGSECPSNSRACPGLLDPQWCVQECELYYNDNYPCGSSLTNARSCTCNNDGSTPAKQYQYATLSSGWSSSAYPSPAQYACCSGSDSCVDNTGACNAQNTQKTLTLSGSSYLSICESSQWYPCANAVCGQTVPGTSQVCLRTGASTYTFVDDGTEICNDGIDNNCNGQTDCADSACTSDPACSPGTETSCNNNVDDDGDGQKDCADSDCFMFGNCRDNNQNACVSTGNTWLPQDSTSVSDSGGLYCCGDDAGENYALKTRLARANTATWSWYAATNFDPYPPSDSDTTVDVCCERSTQCAFNIPVGTSYCYDEGDMYNTQYICDEQAGGGVFYECAAATQGKQILDKWCCNTGSGSYQWQSSYCAPQVTITATDTDGTESFVAPNEYYTSGFPTMQANLDYPMPSNWYVCSGVCNAANTACASGGQISLGSASSAQTTLKFYDGLLRPLDAGYAQITTPRTYRICGGGQSRSFTIPWDTSCWYYGQCSPAAVTPPSAQHTLCTLASCSGENFIIPQQATVQYTDTSSCSDGWVCPQGTFKVNGGGHCCPAGTIFKEITSDKWACANADQTMNGQSLPAPPSLGVSCGIGQHPGVCPIRLQTTMANAADGGSVNIDYVCPQYWYEAGATYCCPSGTVPKTWSDGTFTCFTPPRACGSFCGDFACGGSETCSSCPGDCGQCPPVCGDGNVDAGEACDPGSSGGGICSGSSSQVCDADCSWKSCVEVCGNGEDDDGDGQVDEGCGISLDAVRVDGVSVASPYQHMDGGVDANKCNGRVLVDCSSQGASNVQVTINGASCTGPSSGGTFDCGQRAGSESGILYAVSCSGNTGTPESMNFYIDIEPDECALVCTGSGDVWISTPASFESGTTASCCGDDTSENYRSQYRIEKTGDFDANDPGDVVVNQNLCCNNLNDCAAPGNACINRGALYSTSTICHNDLMLYECNSNPNRLCDVLNSGGVTRTCTYSAGAYRWMSVMSEDCHDGFDNNCNGLIDEEDPACALTLTIAPNPADQGETLTASWTGQGQLYPGTYKICGYAGCNTAGNCIAPADDPAQPKCTDAVGAGESTGSCTFTAPNADIAAGYWVCLKQNKDNYQVAIGAACTAETAAHCNDYDNDQYWCSISPNTQLNRFTNDYSCNLGTSMCVAAITHAGTSPWTCGEGAGFSHDPNGGAGGSCSYQYCTDDPPGSPDGQNQYLCLRDNAGTDKWARADQITWSESVCGDGYDNDCDGLIDCADPDCFGTLEQCSKDGVCVENTPGGTPVCCIPQDTIDTCGDNGDGIFDDDCDGVVDEDCRGNITGTVYDFDSGTPMTGIRVDLTASSQGIADATNSTTTADYDFFDRTPALYTVSANAPNYDVATVSGELNGAQEINLDIYMQDLVCDAGCVDGGGVCNYQCLGRNGCSFNDAGSPEEHTIEYWSKVMGVPSDELKDLIVGRCSGVPAGEKRPIPGHPGYNFVCCSDDTQLPPIEAAPTQPVAVEGCADDLIRFTRIINYEGRPVKMNVLVWDRCTE